MYRLSIRTRVQGPLFDHRAAAAMSDFEDELEEEGAEWALNHIRGSFHANFKQPTGYYESNVRVHTSGAGLEVWDGGQGGPVYGPWLEGVGSRNTITRFKGYHSFRNAAIALERHIDDIGDRLFRLRYRNRLE